MEIERGSEFSVKQSYFNLLALFFEGEKVETRYVKCLLKWGLQLKVSHEDIMSPGKKLEQITFRQPVTKVEKLEAIYHLVQMIYLDDVVDDVELEVATFFAEKLGFSRNTVGDLFKSIATKDSDGFQSENIRKEVTDFLNVHNA
jgi:hypothetical protein